MELDAGAGAWCGARILQCRAMPDLNACYANLAVKKLALSRHPKGSQEAPLGSSQNRFSRLRSSRAGTYTQGVSNAPEDYSAAPKRSSGILEAPVGYKTAAKQNTHVENEKF